MTQIFESSCWPTQQVAVLENLSSVNGEVCIGVTCTSEGEGEGK